MPFLAGFMVCFLNCWCRATAAGGANANVRSLDGPLGARSEDAAGVVKMILTSVDGRVTSSVYFLIIKVDARSVAG